MIMMDKEALGNYVKQNREFMTRHRKKSVSFLRREKVGVDQFTGDDLYEDVPVLAECTWRELTGKSDQVEYVAGVRVEPGEVIAEFDVEVDLTGVRKITRNGTDYYIKAKDTVGLFEDNRHYVLLERVT